MSDSRTTAQSTADSAIGAALTITASAAALTVGAGPEAAAGVAVFAGAIPGIIRTGYQSRAERRCALAQQKISAVAAEYDIDLRDLDNAPETTEAFLTMFHDLMDAIDDAASGPLGHITMTYVAQEMPADEFFRAFGRTVRELSARELYALESLLRDCVCRLNSGRSSFVDSENIMTKYGDITGSVLLIGGASNGQWEPAASTDNGLRILALMKQYGLAVEPTDFSGTIGANPMAVRIWKDTATRALCHLEGGRLTPESTLT